MAELKKKFLLFVLTTGFWIFLVLIILISITSKNNQRYIVFEGYNSELYETVHGSLGISPEVEALRSIVMEYAVQYGIEDYINLLLAVIMQESGGTCNDVFQASESLGLPPNSLSMEESINQGVKVMSARLKAAGVMENTDIINIRLALQGYNFGGGYITYALMRDGMWTQENTNSFAKEYSNGIKRTGAAANNMGIWAYGDQYYSAHVLRYYVCSFSSEGNGTIVSIAESCLDCPYQWGATGPTSFDCSGLVFYCYKNSGKYTGMRLTASGYKNVAMQITEAEALPGDLVFFTKNGITHHIGIYVGNGQMIHAPRPGQKVKYATVYRQNEDVTFGRLSN